MSENYAMEHLECLQCGWETRDDETMELMNDDDDLCPFCRSSFFLWSILDGEQVVTSGEWRMGYEFSTSRGYHRIRRAW